VVPADCESQPVGQFVEVLKEQAMGNEMIEAGNIKVKGFTCPNCNIYNELSELEGTAAKRVKCSFCGGQFIVTLSINSEIHILRL